MIKKNVTAKQSKAVSSLPQKHRHYLEREKCTPTLKVTRASQRGIHTTDLHELVLQIILTMHVCACVYTHIHTQLSVKTVGLYL